MDPAVTPTSDGHSKPRWQPIHSIDRRVLGVLAEKAKTTPDIYPMSLNAIRTGCNQKNNRSPLVEYEAADVEESLDRLRELGAVGFVEGYGRVQKYRHYLYEWLGVDKVELAVMTELLLRGDQTVGELRARASRMEPLADQTALARVLDSLKAKGLVIGLTPEGRGHVVTHALYKPREIEAIRARYADRKQAAFLTDAESSPTAVNEEAKAPSPSRPPDNHENNDWETLRQDIAQLRRELDELRAAHAQTADELHALKESLGG